MWRRGVSTGRRLVFVRCQVVFRQNESFKSAPRFINMQYIHPQPAGSAGHRHTALRAIIRASGLFSNIT